MEAAQIVTSQTFSIGGKARNLDSIAGEQAGADRLHGTISQGTDRQETGTLRKHRRRFARLRDHTTVRSGDLALPHDEIQLNKRSE
jgi:hypothetical protein